MKKLFTLTLLLLSTITFAQNSIKRGPYLNSATQDGIKILFRTANPCQAKVLVTKGAFSETFEAEAVNDSDHVVVISGLESNEKYQYQCFCGDEALSPAEDPTYTFKIHPGDDYTGPINIWAIGDFGEGSPEQIQVKESYENYMRQNNLETDVWLMLGDNAYNDGTDLEYQTNNFDIYPELLRNTTVWPAPGNHDYKSVNIITHNGPYYEIYDLPTTGESGGLASANEFYYSFDYGNAHFVCLNSEYSPYFYIPVASPMAIWLLADLQQSNKRWKIAFWHQPAYTKGSHDSDDPFAIMSQFRQNIGPILELGGVDVTLQGHSHCYERSFLINGHYGYSAFFNEDRHVVSGKSGKRSEGQAYYKAKSGLNANRGTIYNVVGNSGRLSSSGTLDHPVMYYSDNVTRGSVAMQIHNDTLTSRYLTSDGNILDEYSIIKTEDGEPETSVGINDKAAEENLSLRVLNMYGKVWLSFELSKPQEVELKLYNNNGQEVATLLEKGKINQGKRMYEMPQELSAGNYIAILKTSGNKVTNAFSYQK